jgi:hypothetical protein
MWQYPSNQPHHLQCPTHHFQLSCIFSLTLPVYPPFWPVIVVSIVVCISIISPVIYFFGGSQAWAGEPPKENRLREKRYKYTQQWAEWEKLGA